ncbi:MAG TPA: hypothetical protein VH109_08750 [Steroidobacteraceae bacterium]|nr:hypothetical protein [Steroidobacteraceae bacterium]
MHDLVIVIADLYLPPAMQAARDAAVLGGLPGVESLGRYGARQRLASGWCDWLAGWLGRADLIGAAPARLAAAAAQAQPQAADTLWVATPVHLSAGLTRVHLEHQGLLHLNDEELAQLAREFNAAFAGSAFVLAPAACRELLLSAPESSDLSAVEPARRAGTALTHAAPQGAQGAQLRRLAAEIEMWLHNGALNAQRTARGALPVTTLWLWGAQGTPGPFAERPGRPAAAFGCDARLAGLMALGGSGTQDLPALLVPVLECDAERALVVLHVGSELQENNATTLAEALLELDARYVVPALAALAAGRLRTVTLVANDRALTAGRLSRLRLWRRARFGLEGLT